MSRATRARKRELLADVERLKAVAAEDRSAAALDDLWAAYDRLSAFYGEEAEQGSRLGLRLLVISIAFMAAGLVLRVVGWVLS